MNIHILSNDLQIDSFVFHLKRKIYIFEKNSDYLYLF